MTYEELVKTLTLISNSYPNKFKYPTGNEEDDEVFEETWFSYLSEYPYKVVAAVIRKLSVNNPTWPPTVGEVVQEIEKLRLSEDDEITGPEAWQMTINAVGKYSAIYNPEKVLENLPELVRKTAQVVGLRKMAFNDEADTFLRSSFIQTYEQIHQHEMERKMLPGNIRDDVDRIKRPETKKLADKFTRQLNPGKKEVG